MTHPQWSGVDRFLCGLYRPDPTLETAIESMTAAGLPAISISRMEGQFLWLLARMQGTRTVLEIGTLGGYSTIWLARALPEEGRVVTLDIDPAHMEIARANLARARVADRVDARVGRALDLLPRLVDEFPSGFDLVFIDADKTSYPEYWGWALKLSHPGTLIVADNVVRDGAVADAAGKDADARAVRRYLELMAAEPRVRSTVLQTVGPKGYDGMSLALVLENREGS